MAPQVDPRPRRGPRAPAPGRGFAWSPRDDVQNDPYAARPDALRDGLEHAYRLLAGTETDERRRWDLVDRANAVRRWTLR